MIGAKASPAHTRAPSGAFSSSVGCTTVPEREPPQTSVAPCSCASVISSMALHRGCLVDQAAERHAFVARVTRPQLADPARELPARSSATIDECAYSRCTEMHAWPARRKPPREQRSAA